MKDITVGYTEVNLYKCTLHLEICNIKGYLIDEVIDTPWGAKLLISLETKTKAHAKSFIAMNLWRLRVSLWVYDWRSKQNDGYKLHPFNIEYCDQSCLKGPRGLCEYSPDPETQPTEWGRG